MKPYAFAYDTAVPEEEGAAEVEPDAPSAVEAPVPPDPGGPQCSYCGKRHDVEDCLAKKLGLDATATKEQIVMKLEERFRKNDFRPQPRAR